jgi:hypothetical protein
MNYNIGDFIITYKSWKPGLIITKENRDIPCFLVSVDEFNGDYMWISNRDIIELADLKSEEKLSIVANFGNWFYDQHKLLYQELIIENLGA